MKIEQQKVGIFLVSLGSPRLTPTAVARVIDAATESNTRLTVYLLDSPEQINQKALYNLDANVATDRVEELCLKLVRGVPPRCWENIEIRRMSEITTDAKFCTTFARIQSAFNENRTFAQLSRTQVFKNLHPILQRIGVRNQRHPLVDELADYLLMELALKLFLLEIRPYNVEYAWGEDMDIWKQIVAGTFAELPAPANSPEFVTLEPSQAEPSSLALKDVTFRYNRRDHAQIGQSKRRGIERLSLTVSGISAILGPSGAFKTTLLKLIAGHLTPSSGSIFINNEDVTCTPCELRKVATVFQDFALFPHLSGIGNVLEGGRSLRQYTVEDRSWLGAMYLRRLNVAECANRLPEDQSGGEQQRVAIARALMAEPKLLLLDEPTAALDSLQRESLAKLIKQLSETSPSLTILIVSHDREFVLTVAENLTLIDEGGIVATGTRAELLARPPNRRTSEILGTHSAFAGRLNHDGIFTVGGSEAAFSVEVTNPPAELMGTRCVALIRHDGITIRDFKHDSSSLCGAVTDVVDYGSILRATIRIFKTYELIYMSVKTESCDRLQKGTLIAFSIRPEAVLLVPY